MFESMKHAAKLASLMKDLPRIKSRMEQVREEMALRTVRGTSGGGAVNATVNGKLKVVSIELSPALVAGLDSKDSVSRAYAEALVAEAVNSALEQAHRMVGEALTQAARELDVPLPEGMLGELLGQ
ncbi:MAG: YbaB/EbfC family nucleoid-associated protein [Phycisphaerales bacterium]